MKFPPFPTSVNTVLSLKSKSYGLTANTAASKVTHVKTSSIVKKIPRSVDNEFETQYRGLKERAYSKKTSLAAVQGFVLAAPIMSLSRESIRNVSMEASNKFLASLDSAEPGSTSYIPTEHDSDHQTTKDLSSSRRQSNSNIFSVLADCDDHTPTFFLGPSILMSAESGTRTILASRSEEVDDDL